MTSPFFTARKKGRRLRSRKPETLSSLMYVSRGWVESVVIRILVHISFYSQVQQGLLTLLFWASGKNDFDLYQPEAVWSEVNKGTHLCFHDCVAV